MSFAPPERIGASFDLIGLELHSLQHKAFCARQLVGKYQQMCFNLLFCVYFVVAFMMRKSLHHVRADLHFLPHSIVHKIVEAMIEIKKSLKP